MPNRHLKKTHLLIDNMISECEYKNTFSKEERTLFGQFIKQFYQHASIGFLSPSDNKNLYAAALGNWNFIKDKDAILPRKVRAFNPNKESHGWESERTIVELCTTDSPFILDSITAELTENKHKIYEVIHPVMRLLRDKEGHITQVFNRKDKEGKLESIMHFQINYIADEKELKTLENHIDNALYFVSLAVSDWKEITEITSEIANSLDEKSLPFDKDYVNEVKDFINWSLDNNFIFLGYQEYSFLDKDGKPNVDSIGIVKNSDLGIFKAKNNESKPLGLSALPNISTDLLKNDFLVEITKSSRKSIIHRPVHMDYIGIKKFDSKGNVIGEHRLLGLFTSSVYYQSAKLIPIIRKKINSVVERSQFSPSGHNGKALLTVLESYPRDELLQISEDNLFEISMGIVTLAEKPTTKLFIRKDRFSRFISCLVFVPRDMFNTNLREKLQSVLEKAIKGQLTDYYTQVTESPLARIHMLIQIDDSSEDMKLDIKKIEKEILEVTNSWVNGFREMLIAKVGERIGEATCRNYVLAFPETFKDLYHFGGTYKDIIKIEEAYKRKRLALDLDLYKLEQDDERTYQLKIYHPETQVTLSNILPILENMGFHVIDELTFFVQPSHMERGMWIHHFKLIVNECMDLDSGVCEIISLDKIKNNFEEALLGIWGGDIEDDKLNELILRADLKSRDIMILRAYSKYIMQTDFTYSHDFMSVVLTTHPIITDLLIKLFHARFDPKISATKRKEEIHQANENIENKLKNVENIVEDRIINQFIDTINATLRTNYFQEIKLNDELTEVTTASEDENDLINILLPKKKKISNISYKPYISFKLDSAKVPNLPLPHPYAEIFVYSPKIEGIHLRGGKVARGGLRWSDRAEDFRTEILGLAKAQMVKNSVIVPTGSKGGFVVKNPIDGDRDAFLEQGIDCYKTFLSGLLDITDNIIDGKISTPEHVICHDGDDPYLVVAADKGTATFSDIANGVAKEYNFWLDDAFASGGSVGYDHKKMGITARGAWVSVKRHFMEMMIDCQKEDFTTVGIGDMGGDVFGNGMLLSKHIRLIAAFNHMHIFIDPNPDSTASYTERKRLFEKPRSSWTDYDEKLISKGGGIFSRKEKSINVTKEMQEALSINDDLITPDNLIKKILTAKVDLLWNGGIGTYVKAEDESDDDVGDKANDTLRINGNDLRCKIVGEGGNLGLTQKSRIEYAMNGGRINTDAIDNSAGVDCSDHEVNIKIALRKAMDNGKITLKQRNKILADMTDEIAELVLRDNSLQTQAITYSELQGHMIIEQQSRLMHTLEQKNLLDRDIEFLPNDKEISIRQNLKKGLTRPEISVLLAYSKFDIYEDIINSNIPDEPYFNTDLFLYFPKPMHSQFKEEIENHELRREIIATSICNSIVNRVGTTFFQRVREDMSMKGCDVARAYTVTRDAFKLRNLWNEIEDLGNKVSITVQNDLHKDIEQLIERSSSWLLRHSNHPLNVLDLTAEFSSGIEEISNDINQMISSSMKNSRDKKLNSYLKNGVPEALALRVANLELLSSSYDIIRVAKGSPLSVKIIGEIYYSLSNKLNFSWLRSSSNALLSDSHWGNLAIKTFNETLFDQQMKLTSNVISTSCKGYSCVSAIDSWFELNSKSLDRYKHFVSDLKKQEKITSSMITIAIQRIATLCAGID